MASSSSSTLIQFLILSSIFLINFNFCSAHNRRMLALEKPSMLQFGSAPAEGVAILPTALPIIFEEPSVKPSPPVQVQQEPAGANIIPSFFPFPSLPSLPKFPPFPFIPTLPFGPGFDTISPADSIPPPPVITEP